MNLKTTATIEIDVEVTAELTDRGYQEIRATWMGRELTLTPAQREAVENALGQEEYLEQKRQREAREKAADLEATRGDYLRDQAKDGGR